jgi:hypothetical protein
MFDFRFILAQRSFIIRAFVPYATLILTVQILPELFIDSQNYCRFQEEVSKGVIKFKRIDMQMEKMLEISELQEILGYTDERSVRAWCKKHKVPLMGVGKRTYTFEIFLQLFLEDELKGFLKANFENPEEILNAIHSDDKIGFAKLVNAPVTQETKKNYRDKGAKSKAAQNFLTNLKSA